MIPYVLTTREAERWQELLPATAHVMGSVEYARIVERHTGYPARLFVAPSGPHLVAYPHFVRPVGALAFAPPEAADRWDAFTPQYTGPLRIGPGPAAGPPFAEAFAAYCREQGIVAEFAHLDPWAAEREALDPACVQVNREIVFVDLSASEQELWRSSLDRHARRHAKQARRAGVRVRRASSREDVLEFHRLYDLTMKRRHAEGRYRFPPDYFLAFHETMAENACIFLAEVLGRAVAGGLWVHDTDTVYWLFSAADIEDASARPVEAYVLEAICWAKREGKRRMVLGGGYQPDDGLLRFKVKFSPLRAQFPVYKRVHDPGAYAAIARAWTDHHGGRVPADDFFPVYRATARADEARQAALVDATEQ
jgi:serine/alanine adding enzyme